MRTPAVVVALLTLSSLACGARSDISSDDRRPDASTDAATPPPPSDTGDFTLSVTPSSLRITQGGAAQALAVHVDRVGAFHGEVDLDLTGLTTGMSATTAVLDPGVSDVTLTLSASLATEQGKANGISVRGITITAGQKTTPLGVFVRGCPGCLDTTFGTKGHVTVAATGGIAAIAVDASDRILLTAYMAYGPSFINRFMPEGPLDVSFGVAGVAKAPYPMAGIQSLRVAADGRILAFGGVGADATRKSFVARYDAAGALDNAFGTQGATLLATPYEGWAGVDLPGGGVATAGGAGQDLTRYTLDQFLPSGAVDTSFGMQGHVAADWSSGNGAADNIVRMPDGRLVIAGTAYDLDGFSPTFALTRYSSNGAIDPTFGNQGQVVGAVQGTVYGMIAVQGDEILMFGLDIYEQAALARFLPGGSLDPTFGKGGVVLTSPFALPLNVAMGAIEQPDGKVVVLDFGGDSTGADRACLFRLNPDGSYDSAFGKAGVAMMQFGQDVEIGIGPAVQSDGRILAAGWAGALKGPGAFMVVRYWN